MPPCVNIIALKNVESYISHNNATLVASFVRPFLPSKCLLLSNPTTSVCSAGFLFKMLRSF